MNSPYRRNNADDHEDLFNGIFAIYIYGDEPELRYTKPYI